jgi:transposase
MTEHNETAVVIGVDTHKDFHVGYAKDLLGRPRGQIKVPATTSGYRELLAWAQQLGVIATVGIEGTGSYGAGLTRFLAEAGIAVAEVGRPNRQRRARRGKSDPIDAEAAAAAVLAGDTLGAPKSADGPVEMLRVLRIARVSAVKAKTAALLNMRDMVITAPDELRAALAGLRAKPLVLACAGWEPAPCLSTPTEAVVAALASLARRWLALDAEARSLDAQIATLVKATCPALLESHGVGPEVAAALLVAVGDNPGRLRNEAALAKLCGVAPLEASSGRTVRHRLNRGGNRHANNALHTVIVVRLRRHQPTLDYLQRRLQEGKTKKEIMRCLKRYLVRELYPLLQQAANHPGADLIAA